MVKIGDKELELKMNTGVVLNLVETPEGYADLFDKLRGGGKGNVSARIDFLHAMANAKDENGKYINGEQIDREWIVNHIKLDQLNAALIAISVEIGKAFHMETPDPDEERDFVLDEILAKKEKTD